MYRSRTGFPMAGSSALRGGDTSRFLNLVSRTHTDREGPPGPQNPNMRLPTIYITDHMQLSLIERVSRATLLICYIDRGTVACSDSNYRPLFIPACKLI